MALSTETAEVLALAREWRNAASNDLSVPNNDVSRFLKSWIALNALYALRFPAAGGDRKQLQAFSRWPPVEQAHLSNRAKDTYARALLTLAEYGVLKFGTGKPRLLTMSPPYEASDTLNLIYQVRCNLFHGRKSPQSVRDASLIKSGHRIVCRLVDAVLESSEAIWEQVEQSGR